MLLLDSLLMAPGTAVMKIFEELARKAQEEFLDDGPVKKELQEIYALLEAGRLSEPDFASREEQLLRRLQQIASIKFGLPAPDAPPEEPPIDVVPIEREADVLPPALDFSAFDVPRVALPTLELPPVALPRVEFPPLAAAPVIMPAPPPPVRSVTPAPPPPVPIVAPASPPPTAVQPPSIVAVEAPRQAPAVVVVPEMPRTAPAAWVPEAPMAAPAAVVVPQAPREEPPPAAIPEPPAATAPVRLTPLQVADCALRGLAMLRMKVSAVTAVTRAPNGWQVIAELVESRAVPDTSDLLGVYEVQLDEGGNILGYVRTRMRRRCDLGDRR